MADGDNIPDVEEDGRLWIVFSVVCNQSQMSILADKRSVAKRP
jgi:hypothetical protein